MTSVELENLARIGKVKRESPVQSEIDGLIQSGRARLTDARNSSLSRGSRFDLAYNAAHAFSLAALRHCGFRSDNRYIVFQALPNTLGLTRLGQTAMLNVPVGKETAWEQARSSPPLAAQKC
jgi:hypothetical protein